LIKLARSQDYQIDRPVHQHRMLIDYLRMMVIGGTGPSERLHAVFLDHDRVMICDTPLGQARNGALSFRMRELFEKALSAGANCMIVAHNHPSGQCRPSSYDISATKRLKEIAWALDIELLDHLIFTTSSVYSMRAGGDL